MTGSPITVTISGGAANTATLNNLPIGDYTVFEAASTNGTTLTGTNYKPVSITPSNYTTVQTVSFTNDKEAKGGIEVTKNVTVNGSSTTSGLADGTYTFHIYKGTVTADTPDADKVEATGRDRKSVV